MRSHAWRGVFSALCVAGAVLASLDGRSVVDGASLSELAAPGAVSEPLEGGLEEVGDLVQAAQAADPAAGQDGKAGRSAVQPVQLGDGKSSPETVRDGEAANSNTVRALISWVIFMVP